MKKLLIGLFIALASSLALADSVIVEGSTVAGVNGGKDGQGFLMKYGKNWTQNFETDVQYQTTQTAGTNAMSTRIEVGAIPSYNIGFGTVYARAAYGEKFNTTGNFAYYSVEPGIIIPLGSGFSTRFGYRYRNSVDSDKFADQTNTARAGVRYDFDKSNAVNLRYDRVRGDVNQNIWALSYIRSF
jgi:hypothetical protein